MRRRAFLLGAAGVAGAAIEPEALGVSNFERATPGRLKVVVTGGHPGDPEYGCGGTVSRLTGLGAEVVLLYLNKGSSPVLEDGPRVAEAKKACGILKARAVFAGQEDAHAVVDPARFAEFQKLLEAEKPDLVMTHWPIDNHRDHRAISSLAFDAWGRGGRNWALYYYEVSDGEDTMQFAPTHWVDISAVEAVKRAACFAHASQSPERYYAMQDEVAAFRGVESGYRRAEAYVLQQRGPGDLLGRFLNKD